MAKQSPLQNILTKPLSRKEFLQHIGVFLLAVVGVTSVMQRLLHADHHLASGSKSIGSKFGSGKYGG